MTNTPRDRPEGEMGWNAPAFKNQQPQQKSGPSLTTPKSRGLHRPDSKAVVVRNTCGKDFTGEHDPFITTGISSLIPTAFELWHNQKSC